MSFISSENLNRIASVAKVALTQADTFPYVFEEFMVGIDAINNDGTTTLEFNVIIKNGDSLGPFKVPPGAGLSLEYPPFKTLEIVTNTTSFDMAIRGTLEE